MKEYLMFKSKQDINVSKSITMVGPEKASWKRLHVCHLWTLITDKVFSDTNRRGKIFFQVKEKPRGRM